MTEQQRQIALDHLARSHAVVTNAHHKQALMIDLARQYGATEHDIQAVIGGQHGREGRQTIRTVPD